MFKKFISVFLVFLFTVSPCKYALAMQPHNGDDTYIDVSSEEEVQYVNINNVDHASDKPLDQEGNATSVEPNISCKDFLSHKVPYFPQILNPLLLGAAVPYEIIDETIKMTLRILSKLSTLPSWDLSTDQVYAFVKSLAIVLTLILTIGGTYNEYGKDMSLDFIVRNITAASNFTSEADSAQQIDSFQDSKLFSLKMADMTNINLSLLGIYIFDAIIFTLYALEIEIDKITKSKNRPQPIREYLSKRFFYLFTDMSKSQTDDEGLRYLDGGFSCNPLIDRFIEFTQVRQYEIFNRIVDRMKNISQNDLVITVTRGAVLRGMHLLIFGTMAVYLNTTKGIYGHVESYLDDLRESVLSNSHQSNWSHLLAEGFLDSLNSSLLVNNSYSYEFDISLSGQSDIHNTQYILLAGCALFILGFISLFFRTLGRQAS